MKNFMLVTSVLPLFLNIALASEPTLCDGQTDRCTFVLLGEHSEQYSVVNRARADRRYSPFSTFKIPNSMIALETGVVKNLEQELAFDQHKYPIQKWWPTNWYSATLNLREAFSYSAVPVYQEIASDIGEKTMDRYLRRFDYGNGNISSGVDNFWLNGSLAISANEQVAFIQNIYNNKFSLSERTISLLRIMLVEETSDYKLYAKTGGGRTSEESILGWYVGFVENNSGTHYFAFNMDALSFSELRQKRIEIAKSHLRQAGVL